MAAAGVPVGVPHEPQNAAPAARFTPHLEQYTVRVLRSIQCSILVEDTFNCKRSAFQISVVATFAQKLFQPISSFRATFAGGGGKQYPRLVAIFRHSPASAEKLGEIDFRGDISLPHGHPEQSNRCRNLRRSTGRSQD